MTTTVRPITLGTQVSDWCAARKLGCRALGKLLFKEDGRPMSAQVAHELMNDKVKPSPRMYQELARVLGTDVDTLKALPHGPIATPLSREICRLLGDREITPLWRETVANAAADGDTILDRSSSLLNDWRSGRREPSANDRDELARVLGVSPHYFTVLAGQFPTEMKKYLQRYPALVFTIVRLFQWATTNGYTNWFEIHFVNNQEAPTASNLTLSEYITKHLMDRNRRSVARDAGISPAYLNEIANGSRTTPSAEVLIKLALAIHVDPNPLLAIAGHPLPAIINYLQGLPVESAEEVILDVVDLFRQANELENGADWERVYQILQAGPQPTV